MANEVISALISQLGYAMPSDPNNLIYNALDTRLLEKYREMMVFQQGATNKTNMAAAKTNKIDFKKWGKITRGGKITEVSRIPIDPITNTAKTMTIYEYGHGTGTTEVQRAYDSLDAFEGAIDELAEDARIVHDLAIRDTFYTTTNVMYAEDATGLNDIAASDKFSFALMERLISNARLQKMIPFNDNGSAYYLCYIYPYHMNQLNNEIQASTGNSVKANNWLYPSQYGGAKYLDEVGKYRNIRFIETPILWQGVDSTDDEYDSYKTSLIATGDANTNTLTALMTGRQSSAYADQLLPSLRTDTKDFGRITEMAWYARFGNLLLQNQNALKIYTGADLS